MVKLLVGLGNPGDEYSKTRHNIGFMAIDFLAERFGFPKFSQKHDALISKGEIGGQPMILAKPQSYMNLSGLPTQKLLQFYKVVSRGMIVFHDDLDLEFGQLKMKRGGGHAGHNGLRSLDQHIGPDYFRVRMGIGRPQYKGEVSDFVLGNFPLSQREHLGDIWRLLEENIPAIILHEQERFNGNASAFYNKNFNKKQVT